MGIQLFTIPTSTHLINTAITTASETIYMPTSRVLGTGINYTTILATNPTNNGIPNNRILNNGIPNNGIPNKPSNPDCDPEEYLEQKNLMFKNLLKYMDEYTTYNYLKVTIPHYNKAFLTAEIEVPITIHIATNIEKIFYFRLFPDDKEICDTKMLLVRAKLEAKDYSLNLDVCGCIT